MILTYRYRVKSLQGELNRQARACNIVWNYCNDRQKDAIRYGRRWHTGFDFNYLCSGSYKELGLLANTISLIGQQYARSRSQQKKAYLRYRGKKSLGWIPLAGANVLREGNAFRIAGRTFRVFDSRPLPPGKIKDGSSFSRDAKGNWFINIAIECNDHKEARPLDKAIGVDLGLKDFAVFSTGESISAQQIYRRAAESISIAQRANKHRRIKALHIAVGNSRKDFHHKLSNRVVREFDYIVIGDVSTTGLAKTKMAKSVYDAGWSSFRKMLAYKAIRHGAKYQEVDESLTTQTCSACGALPESRPKGIAGLGIREWTCSDCGAIHSRDTNAAINILRRGRATLAAGVPPTH